MKCHSSFREFYVERHTAEELCPPDRLLKVSDLIAERRFIDIKASDGT
jgi:hypothetical protein